MRVAIVHYHLKRGGVTRVIDSSLRGLAELDKPPRCVVLSGEAPADPGFPGQTICLPDLHYSNTRDRDPDPTSLARTMREAATKALGGPPDLWHIHNHSLGKNGAFASAVHGLAQAGEALLLQMHDFAEDGRPENYALIESGSGTDILYPTGPRIHYAVLNGRDKASFLAADADPERLHRLPNPVEADGPAAADPAATRKRLNTLGAERLLLYPVRAVRRKNLGELLLWSATAAGKGTVFASTLGPTNRNFLKPFERWRAFARSLGLPVRLGLCEEDGYDFGELVGDADALVSTSIAEGFGLGFLEPWLHGKGVCGRDLPEITADFGSKGVALTNLYRCLCVPESWIQMDRLRKTIQSGLESNYRAYRRPLPADADGTALHSLSDGRGGIDFGGLDEAAQEAVIERVAKNPGAAVEINPASLDYRVDPDVIERNRAAILEHYSVDGYARRLYAIYEQLAVEGDAGIDFLPAGKILDAFLDPSRFRLLRT